MVIMFFKLSSYVLPFYIIILIDYDMNILEKRCMSKTSNKLHVKFISFLTDWFSSRAFFPLNMVPSAFDIALGFPSHLLKLW